MTHTTSNFLVIPFLLLLGMIASGPVLYPHFWHRYYTFVTSILAALVVGYYIIVLHNVVQPIGVLIDYIQFITLIGALYMASGGILISINREATPTFNLLLLWTGAILSNIISTTGASMLLIRHYIKLNGSRIKAYHIVFFIFMVSNIGGALTPMGDAPGYLIFLNGVPFFWPLWNCFWPWLVALSLLSIIFYLVDWKAQQNNPTKKIVFNTNPVVSIKGKKNILWIAIIIAAMFIDPKKFSWVPGFTYHGHTHSFIREVIFLAVGLISYWQADQTILQKNSFSFAPLKEVVFIFIGIFGTMTPALELMSSFASSQKGQALINPSTLYWGTGLLSSVLDNAPTCLAFLKAGMVAQGQDIGMYAANSSNHLMATFIGAVFFGAMTYVGNGPNFMVRTIAQDNGVKMPSFGAYITQFSIPYLLPVLLIVWLLFFAFV